MAYAAKTKVLPTKTRLEIESLVTKAGATHFGVMNEPDKAFIVFRLKDRNIRFTLPVNPQWAEQQVRSRWRALLLVIKAKLESVESGIETLEEAFLAHVVMPGGETVYEQIKNPVALNYQGQHVPLLPAPKKD